MLLCNNAFIALLWNLCEWKGQYRGPFWSLPPLSFPCHKKVKKHSTSHEKEELKYFLSPFQRQLPKPGNIYPLFPYISLLVVSYYNYNCNSVSYGSLLLGFQNFSFPTITLKKNQPSIILMPKQHILGWQILLSFTELVFFFYPCTKYLHGFNQTFSVFKELST